MPFGEWRRSSEPALAAAPIERAAKRLACQRRAAAKPRAPTGAKVVSDEAKRVGQLIDDLLAFSRLGRQRLEKTDVDMDALARSALDSVVASISPPSAVPGFELTPLLRARGDSALLRQVFANLLGNAVKYSSKQAAPHITVGGWSADRESTYFAKDNGVGFDEKYSQAGTVPLRFSSSRTTRAMRR